MKTFNVALLGAGRMGRIHFANLLKMPQINVKYVYDPVLDQQTSAHDEVLASLLTSDLARVIFDPEIDACVIATPSTHHVELIKTMAETRKHVFCEKPVSFDIDCLKSIKALTKKYEIQLQIGFNRRFDPSLNHLRHEVRRGKIGTIQMLKITNRDPLRPRLDFVKDSGGLFFDFNVHDFDMVHFITNDSVREVYAVGDALVQPELRAYDDIDTAVITIKMASGALVAIDCSRETGYGYDQQLEVFGDLGMLHMKNATLTEVKRQTSQGGLTDPIHHSFVERYQASYFNELKEFFTSLDSNEPVSPGIDDAIAAVSVAQAAMTSLKENHPVVLSPMELS